MQNFAEIADDVPRQRRGCAGAIGTRAEADARLRCVTDPVRRARLGAAARALVDANRGARDQTIEVIGRLLPPGRPATIHPFRVVH